MNKECRYNKDVQNHWIREARYYSKGSYRYENFIQKAKSVDLSSWEKVQEMNERVEYVFINFS